MKGTMLKDSYDEDWKTDSIHPKPMLKEGDVVQVIATFVNFYGQFYSVKKEGVEGLYNIEQVNIKLET